MWIHGSAYTTLLLMSKDPDNCVMGAFPFLVVLQIGLKATHMLSEHCTTELHKLAPRVYIFLNQRII